MCNLQIRPWSGILQKDSKILAQDSMVQDRSHQGHVRMDALFPDLRHTSKIPATIINQLSIFRQRQGLD